VRNPALYPDGFAGLPSSAPDPRFSIVTKISNADYDGLTVTEHHATSRGLQAQISTHGVTRSSSVPSTIPCRLLLTHRVLALMVQLTLIRVTISKPIWFIASPDCGADS
jgi:hypothetical protein